MSFKKYFTKKQEEELSKSLDIKQFVLNQTREIIDTFLEDLKPQIYMQVDEELNNLADKLVAGIKKGDKGDKGEKGDRGDKGEMGKNGLDGRDGRQGKDGLSGKDGKDGINGKDGKDGSPDTPQDIAKKANTLEEEIEQKVIKGLIQRFNNIENNIKNIKQDKKNRSFGGGGGVGQPQHESFTLSATDNSVTLQHNVAASGRAIFKAAVNGAESHWGEHFTVSGKTITLLFTPTDGDIFDVTYIRT